MLERLEKGDLELITAPELEEKGILVAFTGRENGFSIGPFKSLNLSYNVGDEKKLIDRNRHRLAESIGIPVSRWTLCRQVHGAAVAHPGHLELGRGGRDFASGIPRTDSLVSTTSGMAIAVLTADCVPLVIVGERSRSVSVVHAGWRGILAGTPNAAIQAMEGDPGFEAGEALVFVGPHLRQCCMEVSEELAGLFEERCGEGVTIGGGGEAYRLELLEACIRQLEGCGVKRSNVFSVESCTACSDGYFSFRSSGGICGRQGAFAAIKD